VTDVNPRDDIRAGLIWSNILEALENDSTQALQALVEHAEKVEGDPVDELVLLMTTTAALFGQHLERFLGPDKTREYLHALLFDNDISALADSQGLGGE
jgi:hypothetical protein